MLNLIINFYKTNPSIVLDIFKIIIPCLLTYYFTSKNLTAPKRREIKQSQFDLVYLPMYLLMIQYNIEANKRNITLFIKKVDKIIYKNYQYVYPKTIRLYGNFKRQVLTKNPNNYHMATFIYQIEEDYEKLKLELGYPTNSILNNYKRLNKIDKYLYITIFIISGLLIYSISAIYIYLINGEWGNVLIGMLPIIFESLLLYTILFIRKN